MDCPERQPRQYKSTLERIDGKNPTRNQDTLACTVYVIIIIELAFKTLFYNRLTYAGVVLYIGMLLTEIILTGRPTVIVKSAFKFGSSKQGKTCRA